MTQQNNEFEKWFKDKFPNAKDQERKWFTSMGWQAAKADSESILQEQQNTIAELKAHINVLRGSLEEAAIFVDNHSEDWYKSGQALLTKCKQALALTPALKGNEWPNSANLDIYNSVIFSDGSRGTMIMESKIVKWLCKNRAKDYFDEMVESK